MEQFWRLAVLALGSLALMGCSAQQAALTGRGVAADALDPTLVRTALQNNAPDKGALVGQLIDDSETKCEDFINKLVLAETGTDTTLDIIATGASVGATAFAAKATKTALAAVAAIAGGSKTAIDADIFAKASIANFAQAIQTTYYQDMGAELLYVSALIAQNPQGINTALELNRIRPIHKECALASAEATIASSLQPNGQPVAVPLATYTVTVTSDGKQGNVYEVDGAINSATTGLPVSIPAIYPVLRTTEPAASIAMGLQAAVRAQAGLVQVPVSVSPAGKASFTIQGPATLKWTSPAANVSVAPPAASNNPPPAPSPGPAPAPALLTVPPTSPIFAAPAPPVPGHAVNR